MTPASTISGRSIDENLEENARDACILAETIQLHL